MLKIAICDDDNSYLKFEEQLIQEYMENQNIVFEIMLFTSGMEMLSTMNGETRFDIIFLDIEMSIINGIETAKQIRKLSSNVYLVFVTAFITYSLCNTISYYECFTNGLLNVIRIFNGK